ncbi:MAG: hypothetical protein MUC38_07780 [Cyclobacteriaceae bacterium]|nr:hypothetical protein [Cyclobacteriaceae bacterium]
MLSLIHKIPLLTTVFSAFFAVQLYRHWATRRPSAYLLWWLIGVVCYGLGTLTESVVALLGLEGDALLHTADQSVCLRLSGGRGGVFCVSL